jgi:hypothetical protein
VSAAVPPAARHARGSRQVAAQQSQTSNHTAAQHSSSRGGDAALFPALPRAHQPRKGLWTGTPKEIQEWARIVGREWKAWERKNGIRHMSRELRRKVVAWFKDSYPPLPRIYLEVLSTYLPCFTILEDVVRCELQKCKD